MVKGNRSKKGGKTQENTPKEKETGIKDKSGGSKRKRKSDTEIQNSGGTPLNSPVRKLRNDGRITPPPTLLVGDKNNNASVSEVKRNQIPKDGENFLKVMDKKYGRRSDPTELQKLKSPKTKRFSLIEHALRNPNLQIDDGVRMLTDEEDGEIESAEEETTPRVNRKIVDERSQRKAPVAECSKRNEVQEGNLNLQTQPEFQLLLKELREVKEQLKEQKKKEDKKNSEQEKGESRSIDESIQKTRFPTDKRTGRIN